MPPLVVPTTVKSGSNCRSCVSASSKAVIIMCEARCRRCPRRPFRSTTTRPSGTWPAVLHRHRSTENLVTGVMQSRAACSDASVSANPQPSGLIIPAATTATRAAPLFPFNAVDLVILISPIDPRFDVAF